MEEVNDQFSQENFLRFFHEKLWLELGYVKMFYSEIKESFQDKKYVYKGAYKHKYSGMEWLYWKHKGHKSVIICTTFRSAPKKPKEKDDYIAWVLIKDDRYEEILFSFEIRRTKNFFETLYGYAAAFWDLIEHCPTCPECGEEMGLVRIPFVMHKMNFICREATPHEQLRAATYFTDIKIAPENKEFLNDKFGRYETMVIREQKKDIFRIPRRVQRAQKKVRFFENVAPPSTADLYSDLHYEKMYGNMLYVDEM